MGSEGGVKPKWLWGPLFEPATDFYDILNRHADKVLEGLEALQEWVSGENCAERCQRVRDIENEADTLKLEMGRKLADSFITPFDREDIFELINRMDEVINAAKSTVREIEAYDIAPGHTSGLTEMIDILVEGVRNLTIAVKSLRDNLEECSTQALCARKAENRFTKAYRQAMTELLRQDDIKAILRTREVFRSLAVIAERIDLVGEKLQHAAIKMS